MPVKSEIHDKKNLLCACMSSCPLRGKTVTEVRLPLDVGR